MTNPGMWFSLFLLAAAVLLVVMLLMPAPAKALMYSSAGPDGIPTLSSCGAGTPSVVGTDHMGVITTGTGLLTACTLVFSAPLPYNPVCTLATGSTTVIVGITNLTASQMQLGMSLTLPGGKIYYHCVV